MKTNITPILSDSIRRFAAASTGLLCLALLGCGKQHGPLTLSTDGKTKACITLADSASAPEKTAAAELASYLKKMTGAEFPVVKPHEAAGRPTIAVGPGAAKALVPDLDLVKLGEKGLGDDGIVLKSAGRNLIVTGAEGSQRGTLYAVYEFLERAAGVRWWTHTEETVPHKPTLVVAPLDVRFKSRIKPPAPLPEAFRELPASRVIDMDETRCSIVKSTGARIVEDPKASNGFAMLVPKAPKPSWGLQAYTKLLGNLGGFGRYRVYAVARCEPQTDSGAAFVAGIYDKRGKKGLGTASFPIGKPASAGDPKHVDETPAVLGSVRSGTPVTDGEYHVYDLGVYDLPHSSIYAWVGTTTGDLFVDRFLFVKEP